MSAQSPSPPGASREAATPGKQSETSSTRQALPTSLPKRNRACVVGDRRKYIIPSVDKEPEPSEKPLDKIASGQKWQPRGDIVLRQGFDFGSIQNLQDGAFYHRPISLRDLERLESDKFIIPPQEVSNQTRKRSSRAKRDPSSDGGESVAADVTCSNERASTEALLTTLSSFSLIQNSSSSTIASSTPLPITVAVDQPDFRHNTVNANERPIAEPKETTRTRTIRTRIQDFAHPLVSFAYLAAGSALYGASSGLSAILEASNRRSNIPKDMVRIRWTCVRQICYFFGIRSNLGRNVENNSMTILLRKFLAPLEGLS